MRSNVLFDAWPYISVGLVLMGLLVRYMLLDRIRTSGPPLPPPAPAYFGGRVWWSGLLVSVAFHLLVLGFPAVTVGWNRVPERLYLLESVALVTGAISLASWARLTRFQFKASASPAIVDMGNLAFFVLVTLVLLSGCLIVVVHRWGSSWAGMILTPYLASLLRGQPESELVVQMPFLVRLHVFSAFAVVASFPFSRVGGTVASLAHKLVGLAESACERLVCLARSFLGEGGHVSWLWPEED